jgi:integral membrane protein (TIGR01906 family)
MRDVRSVFTGFWLVVLASVAVLALGFRRARELGARAAAWRAVRSGARGLAIVIAVAGVFALVAFDAAFEVFHRLFFSAGSYTFDPANDRLVQLFPERFWSEISIAVGLVVIVVSIVTAWYAGRRAIRLQPVIG